MFRVTEVCFALRATEVILPGTRSNVHRKEEGEGEHLCIVSGW